MLPSMRFSLLLAILPVAIADREFDKCARANGIWAGFDQVLPPVPACAHSRARVLCHCTRRASASLKRTP